MFLYDFHVLEGRAERRQSIRIAAPRADGIVSGVEVENDLPRCAAVRVQKQLVVDIGMNIQATIEAARFSKETFAGCDVQIKARIPPKVRRDLASIRPEIGLRGDYSAGAIGGGQAVLRDGVGVNLALPIPARTARRSPSCRCGPGRPLPSASNQ